MKNESLGGKKIYSSILRKKWIKRKFKIKILFSFTFFNQTYVTRNIKKIPSVSIFYHFLDNQTCNQDPKSSPRRFSDYLSLTNLHKTSILLSNQTLNSLAYAFSNHSSQPQAASNQISHSPKFKSFLMATKAIQSRPDLAHLDKPFHSF